MRNKGRGYEQSGSTRAQNQQIRYPKAPIGKPFEYLFFQKNAQMNSKPSEISDPLTFLTTYSKFTHKEKNFLCGLHQHDILLFHESIYSSNHFVGDIKLRYFISFSSNQVDWDTIQKAVENNFENNFWTMEEHSMTLEVIQNHQSWFYSPPRVAFALNNKKQVATQCLDRINILREPTIEGCKVRSKQDSGDDQAEMTVQSQKPTNSLGESTKLCKVHRTVSRQFEWIELPLSYDMVSRKYLQEGI